MSFFETLRRSLVGIRPHAWGVTGLALISLATALLAGIGDPLVTKVLIDSLTQRNFRIFLTVVGVALCVFTLIRVANALSERLTQRLENQLSGSMTLDMLSNFYRIPYAQVVKEETGYFVSRIYDEPTRASEMVNLIVQLFGSGIMFVGALAVCLWLSWKIAIAVSIIVPILRFAAKYYSSRISSAAAEGNEQEARIRESLGTAVGAYKTVNVFGLEQGVADRMSRILKSYFRITESRIKYASAFRATSGLFLSYAELAVLIGAGLEVIRGSLTIGGLFGFVSAYSRVVSSFQSMTSLVPNIASLGGQLQRIDQFIVPVVRNPVPGNASESIQVSEAMFSIGSRRVLTSCSFAVQPGERVLITGPNGSGKSTLAHILSGFWELDEGTLQVPPLARISSLLTPFVFVPGSVKDNVNYDCLSEEQLVRFNRLASDLGFDEKLEEDPARFSEGEKRRVQIAMTLLKRADFYILDEPLANIETGACDQIMRTILTQTEGKATVIIMHGWEKYLELFDRQFSFPTNLLSPARHGTVSSPDSDVVARDQLLTPVPVAKVKD
jgi:ABC-type multidrug transport system fused ATPase/permease subunit